MPQPPPILEEETESAEADRKVEPPVEAKSKGNSSSVHHEGDEFKRSLGEKALREEAKSIQHMLISPKTLIVISADVQAALEDCRRSTKR